MKSIILKHSDHFLLGNAINHQLEKLNNFAKGSFALLGVNDVKVLDTLSVNSDEVVILRKDDVALGHGVFSDELVID